MDLQLIAGQIAELMQESGRFLDTEVIGPREDGGVDIAARDRFREEFYVTISVDN